MLDGTDGEAFGAALPPPPCWLPPWERALVAEAALPALRPLARARAPHDPATPALVAVMRDEADRLPGWLAHYRRLGVTRFAIVDHGSADATPERLAAEPDVDLYAAAGPFWGKQAWVNAIVARMGYDRWYLHVDADERLVFDGSDADDAAENGPGRGLADLVAFAAARGLRRLRGMLVDLYPPGPLLGPPPGPLLGPPPGPLLGPSPGPPASPLPAPLPDPGAPTAPPSALSAALSAALFDADGYDEALCLERVSRKGGPRRRAFGVAPELTKYPLFRIRPGELVSSPHHLHPFGENYRSDCYIGLLHDKFGPGFLARAERAAAEGNYWQGSREYRETLRALVRDPGLGLAYPGSRRYRGPADLVDAGLIAPLAAAGRRGLLPRLAGRLARRRRAVAMA